MDMESLIARLEAAISEKANRPVIGRATAMDGEPISEQDRYVALAMFHAEQLGIALWEVQAWLQRMGPTVPIAQRAARGEERRARLKIASTLSVPHRGAHRDGALGMRLKP